MFRFIKSSHKMFYIKTALKFGCTPDYVYDVAHGKVVNGSKVIRIREYLMDNGLMHRVRLHSRNKKGSAQ